jgi:hypothetical protein
VYEDILMAAPSLCARRARATGLKVTQLKLITTTCQCISSELSVLPRQPRTLVALLTVSHGLHHPPLEDGPRIIIRRAHAAHTAAATPAVVTPEEKAKGPRA